MKERDYPARATARILRNSRYYGVMRWRKGTLDPEPLRLVDGLERFAYDGNYDRDVLRFQPRSGFILREDEYKQALKEVAA